MARKVIIDCDPGIDDALALSLALFDQRLEVIAITACAGTVDADQATQNIRAIVERLDPPRIPRIGSALDPELGAAVSNGTLLHGDDGLGNTKWEPVLRQHTVPSDKLISDCLRTYPGEVTILCTGPLTGLAKAISRDPAIIPLFDRVIMTGGSITGTGDVTPAAEFNMHLDAHAARAVFQSATTKSLIPFEICDKLKFGWDLIDRLPPKQSKIGGLLHEILPHFFRTTRQLLGHETLALQAILPLLLIVEPTLFEFEEMAGDIEVSGELTNGATVFDRRIPRTWRTNMEVAIGLDVEAARNEFYRMLKFAAQQ